MSKPDEAINDLDAISLRELWRGIARMKVSALISIAGVALTYTVVMHDLGVRHQMSETAVAITNSFDMTLALSDGGSEQTELKGVFFRMPEVLPGQKDKLVLELREVVDDPTGLPSSKRIGFVRVDPTEPPNMMWSRFVADGIFSLVPSARAAETFDWAGHQQRRDFYERVSSNRIVQRHYSDGWILEYGIDARGIAIRQTLRWVSRR